MHLSFSFSFERTNAPRKNVSVNDGQHLRLWYYDIFLRVTQPLRPVGQEPEPSQATDMPLACCFPGKVLGVGCHYFPPPRLHDARGETMSEDIVL